MNYGSTPAVETSAVETVVAGCECLKTEAKGMPPSSLFTDAGYVEEYGASCGAWDLKDPSCKEGEANYGQDWCTKKWCYVSADNTCDPAAYDTVFFADTDYAGTLKFAVSACPASDTPTVTTQEATTGTLFSYYTQF